MIEAALILWDIALPKLDGLTSQGGATGKGKSQNGGGNRLFKQTFERKWVMTAGWEGMKIGADAYIVKPFEPIEFICTVKQLLRR